MLKRRSFLTYFSIASIVSIFPAIVAIFKLRQADAEIVEVDLLGLQDKDATKTATEKKLSGFTVIGSVSDLGV